jgi:hypothetical protein
MYLQLYLAYLPLTGACSIIVVLTKVLPDEICAASTEAGKAFIDAAYGAIAHTVLIDHKGLLKEDVMTYAKTEVTNINSKMKSGERKSEGAYTAYLKNVKADWEAKKAPEAWTDIMTEVTATQAERTKHMLMAGLQDG